MPACAWLLTAASGNRVAASTVVKSAEVASAGDDLARAAAAEAEATGATSARTAAAGTASALAAAVFAALTLLVAMITEPPAADALIGLSLTELSKKAVCAAATKLTWLTLSGEAGEDKAGDKESKGEEVAIRGWAGLSQALGATEDAGTAKADAAQLPEELVELDTLKALAL